MARRRNAQSMESRYNESDVTSIKAIQKRSRRRQQRTFKSKSTTSLLTLNQSSDRPKTTSLIKRRTFRNYTNNLKADLNLARFHEQQQRNMSSPLLNMDLIRPCTNHVYSISPTHKTRSRVANTPQKSLYDDATGKNDKEKSLRSIQTNDGIQVAIVKKNKKANDALTFTRRQKQIVADDTLGFQEQKKQNKQNRPTQNKQLLALQNYNDEFTTLNYKTPIQFERMTKSLRYPEMFIANTLKQENASTKSINKHLNAYRRKMKKQIRENKFNISKDELHTILKLNEKKMPNDDDGELNQNTAMVDNAGDANKLYYEKKVLKVLTPHEEKLQYKHINKLRVEQKKRVQHNELLYKERRMQRRRRQREDNASLKEKNGRKADTKTPHVRIHYSDVDDVIAYKLKQKKKQLLSSFDDIDMQDDDDDSDIGHGTNGSKRKKKQMKDSPVPTITSSFKKPYFANLKMSDLAQRELEDMMVKLHQIKQYNKRHPELEHGDSLNEKKMFQQLNRADTMQIMQMKKQYTKNRRRRTVKNVNMQRNSKLINTPLYLLPIAKSNENYQSVFNDFNEAGNVLWEDLERLYSQVSPCRTTVNADGSVLKQTQRMYGESPLPKATNPFLFPKEKSDETIF
eukprot:g7390.t1